MRFFKNLARFLYYRLRDYRKPALKKPFGVWLYVGLPGKGKTLSMVEYLNRARVLYPGVKIYTNFGYVHQDGVFTAFSELLSLRNRRGVIFAIDEIQLTFNSREWAKFPPEMIHCITQNRKYGKQFICTAQSFSHVEKVFRDLTNYVIECNTVAGRWVWQRAFHTADFGSGHDNAFRDRARAWRYNFVATDEMYEQYNTLRLLEKLVNDLKPAPGPNFVKNSDRRVV